MVVGPPVEAPPVPAPIEAAPIENIPFKSQLVEAMDAVLFGAEASSLEAQKLHKLRMEKGGEVVFKEGRLQALGGSPDFAYMIEMVNEAKKSGLINEVQSRFIFDKISFYLKMARGGSTIDPVKDKAIAELFNLDPTTNELRIDSIQGWDLELQEFSQIFGRSEQLVYIIANQMGRSGQEVELARQLQKGEIDQETQEVLLKIIHNPQFVGALARVIDKVNSTAPEYLFSAAQMQNLNIDQDTYNKMFIADETGRRLLNPVYFSTIGQKGFQMYFQKIDEALGTAVADFYNDALFQGGKRTLELAAAQDKSKKEAVVGRKDKAQALFDRFFKYALFTYKENGQTKGFNDKLMVDLVRTLKSTTPAEAMRVILRHIESTSIGRSMPRGYDDELDKALKDFGVDNTNSFDHLIDEMKDADLETVAAGAIPQVLGWAFIRPDYWKRMDFTEAQAVELARIYGGEKGKDFIDKVLKVRTDSKTDMQKVINALGLKEEIGADSLMSGSEKIKQKVAKILFGKDVRGGMKRLFIVLATLGLSDLFGVTGFLAKVIGGGAGTRLAVGGAMAGGAMAGANKLPGG